MTVVGDTSLTNPYLVEEDQFYRSLFEHAGVALIATDVELKVRSWNAAAARMFGASAELMVGTTVLSVFPFERRKAAERLLQRAVAAGENGEMEFEHRDAHGINRELAVTISPIVQENGQRSGTCICTRDITRRIALEFELHQSRKMASLGEMAGAVAHHFNNIIGGIITSVDYANATHDPTIKDRVLQQTAQSLSRATSLIDGLLVFAEEDRRGLQVVTIQDIIADLVRNIRPTCDQNGIELALSVPDTPKFPVPRVQIATVVSNVVQNAIDAMPGGGKLLIDVQLVRDGLTVKVVDTGVGLDESMASRIFEPFWSTKNALSGGSSQARGLGLSVAHGLMHMLGGNISVASKLGEGSCFTIFIPRPDAIGGGHAVRQPTVQEPGGGS